MISGQSDRVIIGNRILTKPNPPFSVGVVRSSEFEKEMGDERLVI